MMDRIFALLGALNMFIAVGAGAFGAHGLKARLDAGMLAIWQTGVTYQMAHALGLLAIAALAPRFGSSLLAGAGWLMFAGIVVFSGSLYVLALTNVRWLGAITPIGGLGFLAGWLLVALAVWRGPTA
ncbi:DUF423 domain-containing protein [Achromobacter aloeverae]|uniref:DUF423 domain-containing protein n=1 Tax=Achromobacter aloeverae TaxID=1750518 RepID=A0A4Q1HLS8_9BURK|nr:DUF423 domain-containing protein [Achromobacter aloeverae]RXN91433.1 DUF423 domain-containing protein [Achromobacter aloeverae]